VLFDSTASPQNEEVPELEAEVTPLHFYRWPPPDLRDVALAHDVIYVGGYRVDADGERPLEVRRL